ncbi:MAG: flagellar hook-associated protein FlgL [Deltaproteobacteria bacterium]|nr:flagellar hook-associated protein FlgL [Deltaproteobacteria bacterium]
MRSTLNGNYTAIKYALNSSSCRLNELYLQASTGKKVNQASDDPSAVTPMITARSQISISDSYLENISSVQDDIDILDGYLDTAGDILTRIKEISVASVNSTLSASDMESYADEVALLKEELLGIANAKVDGKYIFAGYSDRTQPFTESGGVITYNGTSDHIYVITGASHTTQTNLTGDELFTNPVDVFTVISDLEDALTAGDATAVKAQMDNIDAAAEQISICRSHMGNINAQLDDELSHYENLKLQMEETLSQYEDADLVEVLSDVTAMETAFQAALEVSSRVSQLSILDYI